MLQFWRRKRFYVLIFALGMSGLLWTSWQSLSAFAMGWHLKNRLEKQLEGVFTLHDFRWEKGRVTLHHPSLIPLDNHFSPEKKFHAEQITIDYDFSLWQRSLDVKIQFQNPTFTINSTAELLLKAILNTKPSRLKFLNISWSLAIPDGKIRQNDLVEFPFRLKVAKGLKSKGRFFVQFLEGELQGRIASEIADEQTLDLQIKHAPLPEIAQSLKLLEGPLKQLEFSSGYLDGAIQVHIAKKRSPSFEGKLTLSEANFDYAPQAFKGHLSHACIHSFESPRRAAVVLEGPNQLNWGKQWQLANLQGSLKLTNSTTCDFALEGIWSNRSKTAPLKLSGEGIGRDFNWTDNWTSLPQATHATIELLFGDFKSRLAINSQWPIGTHGLTFRGDLFSFSPLMPEGLTPPSTWQTLPSLVNLEATLSAQTEGWRLNSQFEGADQTASKMQLDVILNPDMSLRRGCFLAPELPLKEYIAPLLFGDENAALSGQAEVSAAFDASKITVASKAKNVFLDSPSMRFEIPSEPADEDKEPPSITSQHQIDLAKAEVISEYSIKGAHYQDKKSKIQLSELKAHLIVENAEVKARSFSGYCCELFFAGSLKALVQPDFPYVQSATVTLEALNGSTTNLQDLLRHFQAAPAFITDFPLHANLSLRKAANTWHLRTDGRKITFDGQIAGSISEGKLNCHDQDFALNEVAFDFNYRHEAGALDLDNLQATLFLGCSEGAKEYSLIGKALQIHSLEEQKASFDLVLEDNQKPLMRLAGDTIPRASPNPSSAIQVRVNPERSHLFGAPFKNFSLWLDTAGQTGNFEMALHLPLQTIAENLDAIKKTKLWPGTKLSGKLLKSLRQGQGNLAIDLHYDLQSQQLKLTCQGKQLEFGTYPCKKFALEVAKKGRTWSIEHLKIDKFSLAADLVQTDQKWLINFLGMRFAHSFLLGLKGEYLNAERSFSGRVNLLEIDHFKPPHLDEQPWWVFMQAENECLEQGKLILADEQEKYTCRGEWKLNPDELPNFTGTLSGQNIHLHGYECEQLQAEVSCNPKCLDLKDFTLQDPAGFLQVANLKLHLQPENWRLTIDDCQATDWRPNLMRKSHSQEALSFPPVIVNRLRIPHLEGDFGVPGSFKGKGELSFTQASGGDNQKPLIAISPEVTERSEHNLSLLSPAAGSVCFDIQEAKILPTKFKDIYSAGRQSKFTLTNSSLPSYIDFDGNLELHVHLKHNNLLLKLAHLANFHITGNLFNPLLSVDKSSKKTHHPRRSK